jgi:hypothetical protein
MKRIINEETKKIDLQKAIEVGCFTKWVNQGLLDGAPDRAPMIKQYLGDPNKGKKLVLAYNKNDADTQYHFFEDGTYIKIKNKQKVGEPILWLEGCNIAKIEGDRKQEASKKDQDYYVKFLKSKIAGLLYPTTREEKDDLDYQVQQGKLRKIDLSKGSPEDKIEARPDYFPGDGNYFIYLPAAKNESRDQQSIIDHYSKGGWVNVPCDTPITDDFAENIVDLSKTYKEAFSEPYCVVLKKNFVGNPSEWNTFIENNWQVIKGTINSPTKKLCRQVINNYFVAMDKNISIQNKTYIGTLKQFIKSCNSQHKFHAGTKTDLQQIIYSSKANRPGNDYALKEQNLSNVIRKNLIQISEQKKSFLTETTIVKNRLDLLRESIGKKKNNRRLVFLSVVNEVKNLKNQGISDKIISEQFEDFFNALGGFFGKSGVQSTIAGGIGGTFVEYAAEFLIKMLGIPTNSPVAQLFITSIGNIGSFENIPRMLTECDFTAGLLAKSIIESIAKNYIDDYIGEGFLASALRNTLTDAAFSTDLVSGIQKNISGKVCEIIGQLGDKASEKAKDMKNKALS